MTGFRTKIAIVVPKNVQNQKTQIKAMSNGEGLAAEVVAHEACFVKRLVIFNFSDVLMSS